LVFGYQLFIFEKHPALLMNFVSRIIYQPT